MSLTVCLPELIEQGKLTGARAARARQLYDRLLDKYDQQMGGAAAEARATHEVIAKLEAELAQKKRQTALAAKAQADWLGRMRAASGDGRPIDFAAARADLEMLDKQIDAVRGGYLTGFSGMLERHRRNVVGVLRHRDDLTLTTREMFGEATGDVNAREMADAMDAVNEAVRVRLNAAGADIGKLDHYVPQRHDGALIRALADRMADAYRLWRARPEIDNARVRDLELDGWAEGARREEILSHVFESIWTDGANSSTPGAVGAASLANQLGAERVIHFANADDWLTYTQSFGGVDNLYDAFLSHVSARARDIAMMEAMGPNPNAMIRFQKDWIDKSTRQYGTQKERDGTLLKKGIAGKSKTLQDIYDELTGANKVPDSPTLALTFSGIRAYQVAAKLGSAVISSATDFATMMHTARFNDLPVMRTLGQYMKLWSPGAGEDRALAVRLGLVTEDFLGLSSASYRYTGQELSGEMARRVADLTLRSSGLARHTRNAQWAFGMETFGHLTAMRERAFGKLDAGVQRMMATHGFSEGDWDVWRAAEPVLERGGQWILPENVADRGVAERMLRMVLAETDYAVIMPDIRTRTQLNSMLRPGTLLGEIGRSAFLFKSFPMAIINLHGRRMMMQPGKWNKLTYAVGLGALMMAAGALVVQSKLLLANKDPQPMDNREFLMRALVQSGGLGLFGDLLYNSTNSYGGGFLETLAGPIFGSTLPNLARLTVGNGAAAIDGDDSTDTHVGRDVARLLRSEIPGSSLWYLRLAGLRLWQDELQRLIDPDADRYFRDQARRAAAEGTEYWAQPGEFYSGIRAPDFGNMFEGEGAR